MVSRRRKIKRKHWLKHPKSVPQKQNLDQNIDDSKSHIWDYFIENIISDIKLFYINPHAPADIIKVFFFFDFRFSRRKSQTQSQQKLLIKITYFAIQVYSKHLTHFTNLNSLHIDNNMLPKHCQKSFFLYKLTGNMFLFGVRKNICTASFLGTQELHSWRSALKANAYIFLCS